ncbi:DUF5988 family protein [Streptomyces sporangiiformans]|uniref:Uncharacterized protein n=1 Tax=Streptomyces sporangiiformans TaxID=2315329 RepID=A0A505DG45_9ACTN|nr:DUF5988 family protein [Streptomyces sporangiiformans]TPQ21740.1 hypothetical protein FGD71_013570 [Streptomyces sporangiiformans]
MATKTGKTKTPGKTAKAALEGGPADLPERIVPLTATGPTGGAEEDLKIPHRGGYEHFRPTSRHKDTPEGKLRIYVWWERTEIAE